MLNSVHINLNHDIYDALPVDSVKLLILTRTDYCYSIFDHCSYTLSLSSRDSVMRSQPGNYTPVYRSLYIDFTTMIV